MERHRGQHDGADWHGGDWFWRVAGDWLRFAGGLKAELLDLSAPPRLRDERLPKGPRSASESLDADTGNGSVFQTAPLPIFAGRSGLFQTRATSAFFTEP